MTADSAAARRAAIAAGQAEPISLIGWLRIARRAGLLIASLIVLVPLHYAYRAVHYGSPFPMLFLRYAARVCGAKVEVIGTHLKRDVFFVANHVSWVDILALAGASGTAFVAKAELAEAPVVGWLASLNRTVFVKREHRMGVAEQINALKDALVDNWSVTVFPEGTTGAGRQNSLEEKRSGIVRCNRRKPTRGAQHLGCTAKIAQRRGIFGQQVGVIRCDPQCLLQHLQCCAIAARFPCELCTEQQRRGIRRAIPHGKL